MQRRQWLTLFSVVLVVETGIMLGFAYLLPPSPPLLEAGLDGLLAAILVTGLVTLIARRIRGEAEQRYRAIVEDQTELICRWLPDGTLTFVNGAYCRYFQKSPEELLGKSFMPLIPEEDQAKVEQAIAQLSPDNTLVTYSHRVYAPDGSIRWMEWTDRALYDAKGNLVELQSVGRDITKQKYAEEELARFRQAVQNSPLAIFITDTQYRIQYVNDAFTRITGYAPEEAIGQNPRILKSGFMPRSFYQEMYRAFAQGGVFRGRVLNRRKGTAVKTEQNGVEFSPQTHYWAEVNNSPIYNERGELVGFLSIQQEITEQVLQEERERYQQEMRQRLNQVAMVLANGTTPFEERLKRAMARLCECETLHLTGESLWWEREGELFQLRGAVGDYTEDFLRRWRTLFAAEWELDSPKLVPMQPSRLTWVIPLHAMGQRMGLLMLFTRLTAERYYPHEATIRPLLSEFGEMVAIALINEQARQAIEQARERAELAARTRQEFLANMSHEIRTPLNGILGMLNLLQETPLNAEQRELLSTAHHSAEHLLGILNDILDLARLEAGRMVLESAPFELPETVRAVVESMRFLAQQKRLALQLHIPAECPQWVMGDALRLRQILFNLIGNALKFTHEGGVTVRLQTAPTSQPEQVVRVRFEVCDTGIGIPPERLTAIFEPFEQADGSSTRQYGGTGLGLAICKRLVTLMGGQIGVQSTPGEGSTFWFEIEFALASSQSEPRAEPASDCSAGLLSGLRVLVAEDNLVNQKVITRQLERWGVPYRLAANGYEVLEWLDKEPFDLILMDCQMPEMDGFEATRRLRAQEATAHIPIIALTANALPEDREACLRAGMDDYLPKPFKPEALRTVLERWAQKRPAQAA
jgi:PAS domain S-box-containing protein